MKTPVGRKKEHCVPAVFTTLINFCAVKRASIINMVVTEQSLLAFKL